jgi:hypothetical protein
MEKITPDQVSQMCDITQETISGDKRKHLLVEKFLSEDGVTLLICILKDYPSLTNVVTLLENFDNQIPNEQRLVQLEVCKM